MKQQWRDLLFMHWPVSPEAIRDLIPTELDLDLYEGQAWLGVVPFDMKGVTCRGCPAPRALCDFPEINLRTYVVHNGKPGVWFFSLDVTHGLAVWAARTFFHLPYFKAEMSFAIKGEEVEYRHKRENISFHAKYHSLEALKTEENSFEHWATSRYCLYCQSRKGEVYRGEIQHPAWPLQRAEVEIIENSFLDAFPVGEMHPAVLFSKSLDVVVFPLVKLDETQTLKERR
jgi:uncharacterized protein